MVTTDWDTAIKKTGIQVVDFLWLSKRVAELYHNYIEVCHVEAFDLYEQHGNDAPTENALQQKIFPMFWKGCVNICGGDVNRAFLVFLYISRNSKGFNGVSVNDYANFRDYYKAIRNALNPLPNDLALSQIIKAEAQIETASKQADKAKNNRKPVCPVMEFLEERRRTEWQESL